MTHTLITKDQYMIRKDMMIKKDLKKLVKDEQLASKLYFAYSCNDRNLVKRLCYPLENKKQVWTKLFPHD